MAYTVKLGTFAKNIESTAQPTTTGWAEYNVTLKNGADISNPQLEISAAWNTVKDYNYAVMMGRYYWIVGKNMLRENFCVLDLKVDVLATYKTEIGSSSLYILRSSASSNGNVQDNLYPPTADVTKHHQYQVPSEGIPGYQRLPGESTYTFLGYNGGYVVLNVSGTGTAGATTLILLTTDAFRDLIALLYTAINGFQISDVVKNVVQKFGGNPQELINGAMWMPFAFRGDNYGIVKIGGWEAKYPEVNPTTTVNGLYIDDPVYDMSDITFNINKHPQAATRGAYLNLSPYTSYIMGIPGCGVVTLDASKLINETSIKVKRTIDAFSGQYTVDVVTSSGNQIIAHLSGQIGVPISLRGANNSDKVAGDIIQTLGAAVSGNVIGAVGGYIGTIMDMAGGTPTSSGMGGGFSEILGRPIWLDTIHYSIVDEDNARNGRPLCQVTTPATLGGFMIAQKGDVVMAGPLPEHEEVKRYLETGFFYE